MNRDISVLLVEDNEKECAIFKEYFMTRDGVKLIGITNSSDEALKYVNSHCPEGVILDIELNHGIGSGYKFLQGLEGLKYKPVVVVTTKIDSEAAYDNMHSYGVSLIIYKNKKDYSPELVVDELMTLVNAARATRKFYNTALENIDTDEMKRKRIENRVLSELETIGISDKYKGKKYLVEAICYLVENGIHNAEHSAVKMLEIKHKKSHGSLITVMQTAISCAWRISTIETLEEQYTAVVRHESGVPTVNEFIYYLGNKILKYFE